MKIIFLIILCLPFIKSIKQKSSLFQTPPQKKDEKQQELENTIETLMYNFKTGVHLNQIKNKIELSEEKNSVIYNEDKQNIYYTVQTKSLPSYFSTDNFQFQLNKNSMVIVASNDYNQRPFLKISDDPQEKYKQLTNRNLKLGFFNKNLQLSPAMKIKLDFRYPLRASYAMPVITKTKRINNSFLFKITMNKYNFEIPLFTETLRFNSKLFPTYDKVTNYVYDKPK